VNLFTLASALETIETFIQNHDGECRQVVATGFHGLWEAHKDPTIYRALNSADMWVADGISPVLIARLKGIAKRRRIPGPELMEAFLELANQKGYSSYFYGDTEATLKRLKHRLESKYPGHKICGLYSPPFRPLTREEDQAIVDMINAAAPDVLWVGLGTPKQDVWISEHRDVLNAKVAIGIGAAMRFHAGVVRRAPNVIGGMGLEWLWRFAMEPRKLWRRDLIDGPQFLVRVGLELAGVKPRQSLVKRVEGSVTLDRKQECRAERGLIDSRRNRWASDRRSLRESEAEPRGNGDTSPTQIISFDRSNILGIGFNFVNYQDVLAAIELWRGGRERNYITCTPPYSVMMSAVDPRLAMAAHEARLVLPDGVGVILAAKILGYENKGRVSGPTLMLRICDWGREKDYRHYFYGGRPGVADALAERLSQKYPGLRIAGTYSPPFRRLSAAEDQEIVARVNSAKPDIVWIGLGSPKQEVWMREHAGRIHAAAMIGVGAAFDFHSGHARWAPRLLRRLGFEWAFRLLHEPKRLWKRTAIAPEFVFRVVRQRLCVRKEAM
jgi:N-acetylglucosaminyldiphosphoundecaprenol N-acetyl-beta-D-mannosaminyltransferase